MPRAKSTEKPTRKRNFSKKAVANIREGVRARWIKERQEEIRTLSERLRVLKEKQRKAKA